MKCVKTLLMRLKLKLFKGHPLPNWLKIFQLFYGFRCCVAVTFSLPSYWAKWQWPKCNLYCQQNILPHPRLPATSSSLYYVPHQVTGAEIYIEAIGRIEYMWQSSSVKDSPQHASQPLKWVNYSKLLIRNVVAASHAPYSPICMHRTP